jgi:hypothetical protein
MQVRGGGVKRGDMTTLPGEANNQMAADEILLALEKPVNRWITLRLQARSPDQADFGLDWQITTRIFKQTYDACAGQPIPLASLL